MTIDEQTNPNFDDRCDVVPRQRIVPLTIILHIDRTDATHNTTHFFHNKNSDGETKRQKKSSQFHTRCDCKAPRSPPSRASSARWPAAARCPVLDIGQAIGNAQHAHSHQQKAKNAINKTAIRALMIDQRKRFECGSRPFDGSSSTITAGAPTEASASVLFERVVARRKRRRKVVGDFVVFWSSSISWVTGYSFART
jgi:hypothetical protein